MHSILFVDDEKAILRSLNRLLYRTGWELHFAEDGMEALKILSEHDIDMVISDMRMPNMDGHNLLKEVQRLYPHTIRLILSGFSDEKEIYQAVLDGSAKSYLLKPWEPKQLLDFLKQVFELKDVLVSKNIVQHVENIRAIPTFKGVIEEINQLIDKEANPTEIASVIERDPGTSIRVLQLVNSSSYNNKVGSVKQAVYQIGNQVLKNILADMDNTCFIDENSEVAEHYGFICEHAATSYRILELTYRNFLGKEIPEYAVEASVLHNIGIFISWKIDVPHDEVGGYLLKWWGIPDPIVECAFYHHVPLTVTNENQELIRVLHLANYFAGIVLDKQFFKLEEKIYEVLNIDQRQYEEVIKSVFASGSRL